LRGIVHRLRKAGAQARVIVANRCHRPAGTGRSHLWNRLNILV
jgi:hypothetical protein